MDVVIPTYRRVARQATLKGLPATWLGRTTLVVDQHDAELAQSATYRAQLRGVRVLVHPPEVRTIAAKRAWILRRWQGPLVMLDDDLRFAVRKRPGTTDPALREATAEDLEQQLEALAQQLRTVAHAGWSARQGNNRQEGGWKEATRQMYVLGYDADRLRGLEETGRVTLGRIGFREDMDLTLQLLRLGLPNAVSYDVTADQAAGYAAAGGCTDERTVEGSDADALRLAELHPGLVKVVKKEYKGSLHRNEVVVQWRKAYEQGLAWRAGREDAP